MATRKIKLTSDIPPSIKRIGMMYADLLDIYEGDCAADIISAAHDFPLDLMLIAQTRLSENKKREIVEKYFIVGLAVPCEKDQFKNPLLYFAPVGTEQYEAYKKLIDEYAKKKVLLFGPDGKRLGRQ